jgi:hypothetical protein
MHQMSWLASSGFEVWFRLSAQLLDRRKNGVEIFETDLELLRL